MHFITENELDNWVRGNARVAQGFKGLFSLGLTEGTNILVGHGGHPAEVLRALGSTREQAGK
jgi:hypothetical protein